MIEFKAWYTKEPELIFGNSELNFDPKIGIFNSKPYFEKDSNLIPNQIKIGIIGDANSIDFSKEWIDKMCNPILNEKENPYLFPYFPGGNKLGVELINKNEWNKELSSRNIENIINEELNMKRIAMASEMFINELELITEQIILPNVIIVALPTILDEYIAPATFYTKNIHKQPKYNKFETTLLKYEDSGQKQIGDFLEGVDVLKVDKERYYNFRRVFKAKVMELENPIPTQIFRPKRFEKRKGIQIDSEIAWNFFVGLFYKSGGIPWKVNGLEKNTCYVGVSFYKEKESANLRSSIAQIFSNTGEGLVLRGKPFQWEGWGYPHLDEESAFKLLSEAIDLYKKHWKIDPRRIVLHKSSFYDKNELKGFKRAIQNIPLYDFLSFSRTDMRFFRSSKNYPVLRGTTIRLPNNSCLLYIKGFNPYLKTYRGHGIPRPLLISHHFGDSSYGLICQEIMALSRLNWNSAYFCLNNPITIHFAREIGHILSEYNPNKEVQRDYRFYM